MNNIPHDVPGLWDEYVELMQRKGIKSPRVVIHGGYGKNNFGDDAILHVLITRVGKYLPNAHITVVCHGPANIRNRYSELSNISACNFKSLATLKAIVRSHIYLIGGGGIVNLINIYSGFQTFRIFDMKGKFLFVAAYLAKIFGANTHFYAIGATSFPDPIVKWLARFVLNRADIVSVRDPLSIANLQGIGVKRELIHVLDPALSLEPAPHEEAVQILQDMGSEGKSLSSRPLIGINLRYVLNPEVDNEKSLNETARLTEYLISEKQCDVLFLPVSQHPSKHFEDDLDFGRQVRSRLRDTTHFFILENYPHPRVMMALLGEMDFLILTRLHSVMLGSKMKVPMLTISYDEKVSQFVKFIGREDMLIMLAEFSLESFRSIMEPKKDLEIAIRNSDPLR